MINNKNNFENIIKSKIDNLELPYNHADWLKLESKLPAANNSGLSLSTIGKIAAIIVVSAIIAITVFYNQPENNKEALSDNSIISNINPENDIDKKQIVNITDNEKSKPVEIKKEISAKEHKQTPANIQKSIVEKNNIKQQKKLIPTENKITKIEQTSEANKIHESVISNAEFDISSLISCTNLGISFNPVNYSDNIKYIWHFGDGTTSNSQKPLHKYEEPGIYKATLNTIDNSTGRSSEWSFPESIIINAAPDASFSINSNINNYTFTALSTTYLQNKWLINKHVITNISQIDNDFIKSGVYRIIHICENDAACIDTSYQDLDIKIKHKILMPNAFSPDGDGINDLFGPNEDYCSEYQFNMMIFNKLGNVIFESNSVYNKWNGSITGYNKPAKTGVYVYKVVTIDKYGNSQSLQGTIALYRNY
ncbi:MAG: gliding motility-associated C-terminal domain-containing protein [Bacteroidota bacterium]|nr:gliding motility-associated C-terminal domain-containing protein [Bacteroidota bacterium]